MPMLKKNQVNDFISSNRELDGSEHAQDIRRHLMSDARLLPSDYLNWDGTFKRQYKEGACLST